MSLLLLCHLFVTSYQFITFRSMNTLYCHSEEISFILWEEPDALKEQVVVVNKYVFRVNLLWEKNPTLIIGTLVQVM